MAGRKKRTKTKVKTSRKTRSATQKQLEKLTETTAAPEEEPNVSGKTAQRKSRTASTHKKFGKFRCLLEATPNASAEMESEGEQEVEMPLVEKDCDDDISLVPLELKIDDNQTIESNEVVDSVEAQEPIKVKMCLEDNLLTAGTCTDLQESGTETDEKSLVELPHEISLPQDDKMEYTETVGDNTDNLATELTGKFSGLNFSAEDKSENAEIEPSEMDHIVNDNEIAEEPVKVESPTHIFSVDAIQSEFTVECVSEEVIPVLGEQEIEIGEGTDAEAEVVVEDNSAADNILEEPLVPTMETNEVPTTVPPETAAKSKSNKSPIQKRKPKAVARKKPVPITKTNKKVSTSKSKTKNPLEKVNSESSQSSTTSENSVRRSSRIKSISVLKQRSKGQGLVKPKTETEVKKSLKGSFNDSDTSENSNSGHTDSEKTSADSPSFLTPSSGYDSDHKPVKVKSRWRRSSELEMGNSTIVSSSKSCTQTTVESVQLQLPATPSSTSSNDDNKDNTAATEEEIRTRLKQFIHLKENQYLTTRVCCKEAKKMNCDCFLTTDELERGELGCGEDCLNRLLMIECGPVCPVNDRCTNKRFQKSQFFPCEVFHTDKKGLGIRATASIPYGEFILEYIGEVIGPDEFEDRATEYSKWKNPHYYFMSLRSDAVIDATQKGNISRFINHSCEPNAETQKWTVNGELRIGFFSKRTILAGEEITFDYQFQRYGKEAQKCFCEAPGCRGWLGEEPDDDDDDEEEEEEEEEDDDEEEHNEEATAATVAENVELISKEAEQQPTEIMEEVQEKPVEEIEIPIEGMPDVPIPVTTAVEIADIKKPVKKEKRKVMKRKVRKDIFDDVDVDEEIEMLIVTGLKNQAHTLKLSRLMVRANEASQRTALLRILRHGALPCRRLFLDYHGLRLIYGWMNDAQQMCKTDHKQESLRLELLQTLATLPISNKTMLQDSKVLPTVEAWSTKLEDLSTGMDSEGSSPKNDADNAVILETDNNVEMETQGLNQNPEQEEIQSSSVKSETEVVIPDSAEKTDEVDQLETFNKDNATESIELHTISSDQEEESCFKIDSEIDVKLGEEIRRSVGMDIEHIRSKNQWYIDQCNKKLVQDIIDMFDDDMDISPIAFNEDDNIIETKMHIKQHEEPKEETKDFEVEIIALALKLIEEWSVLKEQFRIPKKERIEQMKEHEREANRGYKAGLEADSDRKSASRYRGLHKRRSGEKLDFSERLRKGLKLEDRSGLPRINKHERRKLFAMQVEQEEVEKRLKQRDMWRQHDFQYMAMGADPRFAAPYDPTRNYQCMWNQQTGQWQNYPIAINHNPLLNPTMGPRFNTGIHYAYSTSNVAPLPNMPPNMTLAPSTLSHPLSNISNQIQNMSHIPHPQLNMPHTLSHMPHPPPNMNHLASNMSHSLPNMTCPPPSMNHSLPNMPPLPQSMSHLSQNMSHPLSNMPHSIQNPVSNLPHSAGNMSLPLSSIPTNLPPPLPNMPPLPNTPNNLMISNVPLPNSPATSISAMSGNLMNTIPLLPNMQPPLPNIPLPSANMQQYEKEDLLQVKFAGPIPPPVKLPPKWKCAKDKYGRPYYYHIKIRTSQWEPPEFSTPGDLQDESSDSTSSSETSSLSSDSSSEDSDDDEPDDTKLLLDIRRKFQQMESSPKAAATSTVTASEVETREFSPDNSILVRSQEQLEEATGEDSNKTSSLDERLKEEFNFSKKEGQEPLPKRKRLGLVTEVHIISPRTEKDKLEAKENGRKIKENKERLKREKELAAEQTKKRVKVTVKNPRSSKKHKSTVKTKLKEAMDLNSELAKKIREAFRSSMACVMVGILNPYRKPDCKDGRITNTEDFKHLARKLTHFVMLKELKHCQNIEDLTCTESVKSKAKEFVRKYMSKFGEHYTRPNDDLDY